MTENVLNALEFVADWMGDPDRVVLNAQHHFETADGECVLPAFEVVGDLYPAARLVAHARVPDRACFRGATVVAAREFDLTGADLEAFFAALPAGGEVGTLTVLLESGLAAEAARAAYERARRALASDAFDAARDVLVPA